MSSNILLARMEAAISTITLGLKNKNSNKKARKREI
jgi:hypothetical protein